MHLYDADDVALILGVKLVVETRLLEDYQIDGLPPGDFYVLDTSDAEAECGFEDFGQRCVLLYLEPSDLEDEDEDHGLLIEAIP